jgi:hypothetical protein
LQNTAQESGSIPQKVAEATTNAPQTEGATQEQTAIGSSTSPAVSATSTATTVSATSTATTVSATANTEARPATKDEKFQNAPTALAGFGIAAIQSIPQVPLPTWTEITGAVTTQPSSAETNKGATPAVAANEPREAAESAPISAQHTNKPDPRQADTANSASPTTQDSDAVETATTTPGSAASATGFVVAQSATNAAAFAATITVPVPGTVAELAGNPISSTQSSATKTTDAATAATSTGASSSGAIAGTVKSSSASQAIAPITTSAPSGQHTQADASAATTVAVKTVEASATISTAASPSMQHAAATSGAIPQGATKVAGESAHTSELARSVSGAPEANETVSVSGINTAKVIQSMGETEMHVGMRSAEFGEISIRTAVSQQQMLAQISVDHSDLGSTIAAHLPAMQAKLGNEYGLHASVEVTQGGTSFTGNGNQSAPRQQKSFAQAVAVEHAATNSEIDNQSVRVSADGAQRLDIQA